ncbi:prepilin-type N-terminal cleavage/methylation domain-containing protein [Bacillus lacus]|uniref:Prepilin-type N-terminal cleavage/methylation domain-containing protein n=1 Tax=Metabacillus lacus TaxID=1983721 RepID=A0A7X2IZP6_9BACI|nr:competence type IV pilus minor pilin ComGD [Metabacillus lacus]MRX72614.1 prepilin-type N-terminal cleavage/methylation domain-containing protein [Metabacillus lacus]
MLLERAFTLIETLLVLSIFTVLLLLTAIHIQPIIEQKKVDHFFEQLEEDILFAQQYAMVNSHSMILYYGPAQRDYRIVKSGLKSEEVIKRELHQNMEIIPLTLSNHIIFNSAGNINSSGALQVKYKKRTFKVTFYLGRGRFRVEEL